MTNPDERMLTVREVLAMIGMRSRTTLRQMMRRADFLARSKSPAESDVGCTARYKRGSNQELMLSRTRIGRDNQV